MARDFHWTWRDYLACPGDVLAYLLLIKSVEDGVHNARVAEAEARARAGG